MNLGEPIIQLPFRMCSKCCSDPVAGFSVQAMPPVRPEGFGQARINGKRKPRGFRLRVPDAALDNTSLHQQLRIESQTPHNRASGTFSLSARLILEPSSA